MLADHCVPGNIVQTLRDAGVTVLRVVDLVDPRASDKDVAALAARYSAVLLTADSDFTRRRDFQPQRFGGIILLKDLSSAQDRVVRRLLRLVSGRGHDLSGSLVILDRRSARVRRS